jgi:hypothetical protein
VKIVYRYGLTAPTENADVVYAEMRQAHTYRNVLVEIERGRRAALRSLDSDEVQTLAREVLALDAACEEMSLAIRSKRQLSRSRSETDEEKNSLAATRSARTQCVKRLWIARRAETAQNVDATDRINERALELQRSARKYQAPYWGTYQLVEDAMQASASSPVWMPNGAVANDPHFLRWTGSGSVGIQIQRGMSVEEALGGTNTKLRIKAPQGAWKAPGGDGKCPGRAARARLAKGGQLQMRVGSDASRGPLWAGWRLDMHRPLPEGSRIKKAAVHLRKRGPHSEWSLTVTLDTGGDVLPVSRGGTIGIDVGWRQIADEIRIAVAVDTDGQRIEYRLDRNLLRIESTQRQIESERTSKFNAARASVRTYVTGLADAPEWLTKATVSIHAWRTPRRLSELHALWMENRHEGDEREFGKLEAWWWTDQNLWAQETEAGLHFLRRRRDSYRKIAAIVADRYGTAVIEQFDLRKMAVLPEMGEEVEEQNSTARSNRYRTAVSDFRSALLNASRKRGLVIVAMPAHDTTTTCHVCGLVQPFDAAGAIRHTCECGAEWDQDENAARVLLSRWRERPSDAKILAGARESRKGNDSVEKVESRHARMRRLRVEKEIRMQTARERAGKVSELQGAE